MGKVRYHCSTSESKVKNCLGIVPVVVKGLNRNTCTKYALIDDRADKTYVSVICMKSLEYFTICL